MIKDITRLDEDIKHDKEIIQICEEITRFFILSINEVNYFYNSGKKKVFQLTHIWWQNEQREFSKSNDSTFGTLCQLQNETEQINQIDVIEKLRNNSGEYYGEDGIMRNIHQSAWTRNYILCNSILRGLQKVFVLKYICGVVTERSKSFVRVQINSASVSNKKCFECEELLQIFWDRLKLISLVFTFMLNGVRDW